MLIELHVRDLALIEEAWLEFGPGMTVLTGETGAGKTALVGAIKLLIGERADSGVVRAGSDETLVEGRISTETAEIVIRRRLSADGRSRCALDGEMASVGELAERIGPMFDLHGQHDHQALLQPARHVSYLDRAIGAKAESALRSYRERLACFLEDRAELRELDERLEEDRKRADYLRFLVDEIDRVDPVRAEDTDLEARLPSLRHGERLTEAAAQAYAGLRDDGGASDSLAAAQASLARVAGLDPALDELAERLGDAIAAVDDVGLDVRTYGESIEHDSAALNVVEARLAALGELKKKYGPTLEDVFSTRDDARSRLESIETGEVGREQLEARLSESRRAVVEAAESLAATRRERVGEFTDALARHTARLGMDGASFGVSFEDLPMERWGHDGPQRVEFLYSPGEGQPLRSLSKIASGGEVSRVMLALKTVLGAADDVPILVFDEVDAGIGGETAHAVGRALARLAEARQVFVVTHLAQVAAFADAHLVVRKATADGQVRTSVERVDAEDRVREIARMLGGEDADTARAHAEELLRGGGAARMQEA